MDLGGQWFGMVAIVSRKALINLIHRTRLDNLRNWTQVLHWVHNGKCVNWKNC